jgi:hypothetical protein
VPLCVTWCIWRERNARTFEDKECSVDGMRKEMISMLHSWALAHYRSEVLTIEEFLNMCSLGINPPPHAAIQHNTTIATQLVV